MVRGNSRLHVRNVNPTVFGEIQHLTHKTQYTLDKLRLLVFGSYLVLRAELCVWVRKLGLNVRYEVFSSPESASETMRDDRRKSGTGDQHPTGD